MLTLQLVPLFFCNSRVPQRKTSHVAMQYVVRLWLFTVPVYVFYVHISCIYIFFVWDAFYCGGVGGGGGGGGEREEIYFCICIYFLNTWRNWLQHTFCSVHKMWDQYKIFIFFIFCSSNLKKKILIRRYVAYIVQMYEHFWKHFLLIYIPTKNHPNHTSWLGVKHQLIYLFPPKLV